VVTVLQATEDYVTSLIGRQVSIKRGPDGKAKLVRQPSYVAKTLKLKIDRLVRAWKQKAAKE
jgi:hypothetical protein